MTNTRLKEAFEIAIDLLKRLEGGYLDNAASERPTKNEWILHNINGANLIKSHLKRIKLLMKDNNEHK